MREKTSGQSILELMFVLAFSSIVFAVFELRQSRLIESQLLKQTVNNTVALLDHCALTAINSHQTVKVRFNADGSVYSCQTRSSESCPDFTLLYRPAKHVRLVEAAFGNLTDEANLLTFRPDGTATPGRITFRGTSEKLCRITQGLRGARKVKCS